MTGAGGPALSGPLVGIRVLEVGGIGPGPYAAMMLANLGAEVLRVEGPSLDPPTASAHMHEGRECVGLDLSDPQARAALLELAANADVLLEGHRPGVAERLGFGPAVCHEINPRLVYARMTGYGQDGPLAQRAGHDINYIAVAGALGAIGRPTEGPPPPLNLVGDFGGGGMLVIAGILAALVERASSGRGQVVDAAMVDGVASFMTMFLGWQRDGGWSSERSSNLIDGGAPFYDTYRTADGRYVAVGALEPKFYAQLLTMLGLGDDPRQQGEVEEWPRMRRLFTEVFATRTRDEWAQTAEEYDACVSPVLDLDELPEHPYLQKRGTVTRAADGSVQVAPTPRFDRTPGQRPVPSGRDGAAVLRSWGLGETQVAELQRQGSLFAPLTLG